MLTKLREKLREQAKRLVERHGAEVGAVAKIAANALIPGAPLIVSAVETVCDYAADKGQEITDERMTEMIEALGGDVGQQPTPCTSVLLGLRRHSNCMRYRSPTIFLAARPVW